MDFTVPDSTRPFRLRPMRSARVSEISEATAAAPVSPQDRVNLHIGNPLQERRLRSMYLRIALGGQEPGELSAEDAPRLSFLKRLIEKSTPYAPRGGYSTKDPDPLLKSFMAWLESQQEPLAYDLGRDSGRREVVLATGGLQETLRVLFHSLSRFLVEQPANVALFQVSIAKERREFHGLRFHELSSNEDVARDQIEEIAAADASRPVFVLLGGILGEETRRALRALSLKYPLFFVEVNDAPNHLSLAREAKLMHRVLRLLTPAIFSPRLGSLATVFVLGGAEILRVFESMHFELKGSPSASEIELLSFLLEKENAAAPALSPEAEEERDLLGRPSFEGFGWGLGTESRVPVAAALTEAWAERVLEAGFVRVEKAVSKYSEKSRSAVALLERPLGRVAVSRGADRFALLKSMDFLRELAAHAHSPAWGEALLSSYLSVFVKHQPQYRLKDCLVVSGSARTALGLLGFHCGISEVIVPDLSWSYEHCFPTLHAVPLGPDLELDVEGLLREVQAKLARDPAWRARGAVVLNNPHNATGRVFKEAEVELLVERLLSLGVFIIDDLSYQNVAPVARLPGIKTVRQHSDELVRRGAIREEQANRVVTVHSLSKTDCLAGARLSVVEIRDPRLRKAFELWNSFISPNLGAVALSYLLYRGDVEAVRSYWRLRNELFLGRSNALLEAMANLPKDRNTFDLSITAPTGSMYPLLQVRRLPSGLSLDWLASALARQGIGMLPLATFARTEEGFEAGRTTFRLTLGGADNAETLFKKMRRVLIDLDHRLAEEAANYTRRALPSVPAMTPGTLEGSERQEKLRRKWKELCVRIEAECRRRPRLGRNPGLGTATDHRRFLDTGLPERLSHFERRLLDRARITEELLRQASSSGLARTLEREFREDSLPRREKEFRARLYDRTVHPTQMYSIRAERALDELLLGLLRGSAIPRGAIARAANELWREFLGLNVAISSRDEADEIILDLDSMIAAELQAELFSKGSIPSLISFWSDWDGSSRPSGQGHRLVAAVVMENVSRMASLVNLIREAHGPEGLDPELLSVLRRLPARNRRFSRLLDDITTLTHQLEKRYRGVLPFPGKLNPVRRLGMRLRLSRDPLKTLWQHNDRFERKMLELRQQRREMLEHYFSLNERLRGQLFRLIPVICAQSGNQELLLASVWHRDLLRRVAITPRIQQSQLTAKDPFAIDTTVHNLLELNEIAGHYGNPGMVLGLQISLSSKAEALITLDRKMQARRHDLLRSRPPAALPSISLIPLFEDLDSVRGIPGYLDQVWEYAARSRRRSQGTNDRFAEVISEVFIAGSDLSQQVGQAPAAAFYRQAKREVCSWLAERHLIGNVRMKLGSGEPMQRQGGYNAPMSGKPAFSDSPSAARRYLRTLPAAARKSTQHAITPLAGILAGGDLRTFQSNLAEELRRLPVQDLVDLLHHVKESQSKHKADLMRAAESLVESRLQVKNRSAQELERLTLGTKEPLYEEFLPVLTESFRQILYGREEDAIGIHIVSYFIARSMAQLRDRPTMRRTLGGGSERGQAILARLAETIPQSRQGSMLRAIAHNQAQSAILGVNQLTTGLFRALDQYARKTFSEGERSVMISERLLPQLPVHEILSSLRLYHDPAEEYVRRMEAAFPASNSAFLALREDFEAMKELLPLFQQELLRRHGVDVGMFFADGRFVPELLPTLRPDLAVLLQADPFNTQIEALLAGTDGPIEEAWRREVQALLAMPREIRQWRKAAWEILEPSVLERVRIFGELAVVLQAFPKRDGEAPVSIIRAINEVKRIAQIEEHAFPRKKADSLRYYQLQIARLAGENG